MYALLSVCPSLIADALVCQGVDRLGRFMAQSMAYGPETLIPLISFGLADATAEHLHWSIRQSSLVCKSFITFFIYDLWSIYK